MTTTVTRRPGRPKLTDRRKDERFVLRLTAEQQILLRRVAYAHGRDASSFVRQLIEAACRPTTAN